MKTALLALFYTPLLVGAILSESTKTPTLTIYDSNIALVHEQKELTLYKNESNIIYEGVAKEIELRSVSLGVPKEIEIESVRFEHDIPTQEQLLASHVGKKVDIRRKKSAYEYETISATLLGYDKKRAIVRTIAQEIISVKNSSIIYESLPQDFRLSPSLIWDVNTKQDVKTDVDLEYLVNAISFKPHYRLYINENSADLIGDVTLSNHSGSDYKNANIRLLIGQINRVKEATPINYKSTRAMASDQLPSSHAVEGYHIYNLAKKISLLDGQTKQLQLFQNNALKAEKKQIARMSNPLYLRGEQKSEVSQYIILDSIGAPLLNATIESYSKENNTTTFLGESRISATPKGESLEVLLGRDLDLLVKQTLIKRQESKDSISSDIEYSVKNSADTSKELTLLVEFNKKSNSIIKSERDYSYTKGNFVTFKIHLTAGASEKFSVHFESEK